MLAIHTTTVDVILVPEPGSGWLDIEPVPSRVAVEPPAGRRTRLLARLRALATAPAGRRTAI